MTEKLKRIKLMIKDYTPMKGFYDLRMFQLPNKIFEKLWKIQNFLFFVEQHKKYYKKYNLTQWEKAKNLSSEYQQILFSYSEN